MSASVNIVSKWSEVTRQEPCCACGRGDFCRSSSDGAYLCRRGPFDGATERQDKNGVPFWVGFPGGVTPTAPTFEPDTGPRPAPPGQLDRAYRELLSHLTLSPAHRQQMLARGFTPDQADALGVKSLDQAGRQVAKRLAELFPFWQSVPGLFLKSNRPALGGWAGMLIPCRDLQDRIIALRIRADSPDAPKYTWLSSERHGGPGPGAPLSYWAGAAGAQTDAVRVTEGELKAALAAFRTGIPTVAAPGVGLFGGNQVLDWLLELGAGRVIIAPDADFRSNGNVRRAVVAASTRLGAVPYPIDVEIWDPASKGIDDALQAGLEIQQIQVEEFLVMTRPPNIETLGNPGTSQWDANPVAYQGNAQAPVVLTSGWAAPEPFQIRDDDLVTAPLWVLPESLRHMVGTVANAKQVTPGTVLGSLLGLESSICGGRYTANLASQYETHAHIWILLALRSSGGKSEALKVLAKPIFRAQKKLQHDTQQQNDRHAAERATLYKQIAAMEAGSPEEYAGQLTEARARLKDVAPKPLPRFLWKDVSPQKLDVLYAKYQRVGIVSPESADWISLVMGYGKDQGPTLGSCLSGFSVEPHGSDRVTREESHCERPVLSLFLACQEDDVKAFIGDPVARRRGFLGRTLVFRGQSLVGKRLSYDRRPEIAPADVLPWNALVEVVTSQVPDSDDDGWVPFAIPVSDEARVLFCRLFEVVEKRLSEHSPDMRLDELEDIAGRSLEQVGRLAILLHVLWTAPRRVLPTAEPISEATVFRAFSLMIWALQGFIDLSAPGVEGAHNAAMELWKDLDASALCATGVCTVKDWVRSGPNRWRSGSKLESQLAILETLGYVQVASKRNVRGPASKVIELNPLARGVFLETVATVATVFENPLFIEVITAQPGLRRFATVATVSEEGSAEPVAPVVEEDRAAIQRTLEGIL